MDMVDKKECRITKGLIIRNLLHLFLHVVLSRTGQVTVKGKFQHKESESHVSLSNIQRAAQET
jgi:hypothetical protein